MAVLVGFGTSGVLQIRRGEVEKHRRSMKIAASLVVVFLVSYGLKLVSLGGEDLARWSEFHRNVLFFHETCVAFFVVAGSFALWRARRIGIAGDNP